MNSFPDSLKTWRKIRRFSQLDLAMEADVSSRHISFLETGRSAPSREMISRLGNALDLPLVTQNQMLTNAGFAVRYPKRNLDEEEMKPIREAVDYTLSKHAPFPAMAIDRLWNIIKMNSSAKMLFHFADVSEGDSLLELTTSDIAPRMIENWSEVAHHTANRLRTESIAQGGVPELEETANRLATNFTPNAQSFSPIFITKYVAGDLRLSLFTTIAQFGTPLDLTLDDLKIELFFPADEATEQTLNMLAQK